MSTAQTDAAPLSISALMTCTHVALAYCPFSAKRIKWAGDAVVEANHVIMFVQCSSAAPIQMPALSKKKKRGGKRKKGKQQHCPLH